MQTSRANFDGAYSYLDSKPGFEYVGRNAGRGAMEFDPNKGEVMIPESVDVRTVPDARSITFLSQACDKFGLKATAPDHKQNSETAEVYIRLVEDR